MVLIDILRIPDKSDAETCLKDEVRDESMHYARNPNPDLGSSSESRGGEWENDDGHCEPLQHQSCRRDTGTSELSWTRRTERS
jgi:hypothetical protein